MIIVQVVWTHMDSSKIANKLAAMSDEEVNAQKQAGKEGKITQKPFKIGQN